jgi:hypothetical protein
MPLSFFFGISGLVVLFAVWVTAMLVLRARRRRSGGYGPLDAVDDSDARQQLASGRDAAALAMAVRGAANRQGR